MKKLNSILFLAMGVIAYAQPSVTRTGIDRINIPITFKSDDVTGTAVSAGPSGANITWDFSAYPGPNVSTTTTNECPGQANCFRFATANRINKPALTDFYDFSSVDDNQILRIGSYGGPALGDVTTTYTDPLIEFKFPITYLQQYTDNYQFSSVSTGIGNTNETGQEENTVDGYGTVITPSGTYTNVLRIKKMRTATQTGSGLPVPMSYTNEGYIWVSQNVGIVMAFSINTFVSNGTTHVAKVVSYLDSGTLSTHELNNKKEDLSVYPNPSSERITLASKEDIRKVSLISSEGKTVLTSENSKNIDISKLPKGVYILQGDLKNGTSVTRKIIKK